jgi:dATP pyrophosphohydrolase
MAEIVCRVIEAAVFRFSGREPEYLLLQRAFTESRQPGLWQVVTGGIHEGERAANAARREFNEEVGLSALRWWTVPYVDSFFDPERDEMNLIPWFAVQVNGDPVLSGEHSSFAWLTFPEAVRRLVWPGQRQGLEVVRGVIVTGEEAARRTAWGG